MNAAQKRAGLIAGVVLVAVAVLVAVLLRSADREPGGSAGATAAGDGGASGAGYGTYLLPPPKPTPAATIFKGPLGDGGSAAPARDPSIFAALSWGGGPDRLGRDRPQEGNPEGPMSVAVDPLGRAVVLDQVNGRLVVLGEDGKPSRTVPVPVQAPQDVAMTADGKAVVLDRLADKSVAIMDEGGKVLGELPVEGRGIDEGGGVTGVFVDGDSVYVERENASLVRVGDTSGHPDPDRPEIPGRPSRDGKLYLNAGLGDARAGNVYVTAIARETQQHLYTREYRVGVPLFGIVALDTDLKGTIYLALLAETAPRPTIRLLCLAPTDGTVIGQTELPATELPEESFRDFAVLNEGGVLYAYRTEDGVEYRRADCH